MKIFVKIFSLLLALSIVALGQNTISVEKIDNGIIGNNEFVTVTVALDDTVKIKSLSMLIKYDPNSITFRDNISSLNLPNSSPESFFMHSVNNGIITIAWTSTAPVEILMNDLFDLFDLDFTYDNDFSEVEILSCKIKNIFGQTLDLAYSDGSITENTDHQVLLFSPNGGEYFEVTGPEQPITWTSVYIGLIDIAYSTDGSTWIPIVDDYDALEGEYSWTIPTISSTTIKVKVTDDSDVLVFDESDNNFRIDATQTLEVLSPDGGEILQIGGAKVISWTYKNVNKVLIEYSSDNGTSWNTIVDSTLASNESYIWDIPNDASVQCLVKISNVDNPAISDVSDAVFIITPAAVPITIPHELNAHPWYPNPLPISGDAAYPYVPGSTDIISKIPITAGHLNAVTSLQITIGYDIEAINFTVWDDFVNTTSILFQVGSLIHSFDDSTITLFWKSTTPYDLSGELFILRCQYSDGTDVVEHPNSVFSEFKFISAIIEDVQGNLIDLDLINGSVSKTLDPVVKLHQPIGGEVLSVNTSPYPIEFSSVNMGGANVRIDYSDDGGGSWAPVIGAVDPALGTYSWDYSAYTASNNCIIFVSSGTAPTPTTSSLAKDTSAAFEINTAQVLNLLVPDGGEAVQPGRVKNITWFSENIDSISIDYSLDSGATWESVITSTPAVVGSYLWSVPDTNSIECLIAITDITSPLVTDTSQAVFIIADGYTFIRLSRFGNLTQPTPSDQKSIFVSFENLSGVINISLQFSFDNAVYSADSIYSTSPLFQLGNVISSVRDTLITITFSNTTPVDLNGSLIQIGGEYFGGTTDITFLGAQIFDATGMPMNVEMRDGLLSAGVVGVDENENTVPEKYFISQNYPNPFNPSTVIQYGIPEESKVSIMVYNTIGQRVATLVDEFKTAGVYNITWNAGNLANGIYFYRITTSVQGFVETKKLLLLK